MSAKKYDRIAESDVKVGKKFYYYQSNWIEVTVKGAPDIMNRVPIWSEDHQTLGVNLDRSRGRWQLCRIDALYKKVEDVKSKSPKGRKSREAVGV